MELAVVAMITVSVGLAAVIGLRARDRRLSRAWEEAARHLGGKLEAHPGRSFKTSDHRIEAVVDGVPVTLDHGAHQLAKSTIFTRCMARAPGTDHFWLEIVTSPPGYSLNELRTFDDRFDRAFRTLADDPDGARVWVDSRVRDRVRYLGRCGARLDAGWVTVHVPDKIDDCERLVAAARVCAALAGRGPELRAAWQEAAAGLGARLETPLEGAWGPGIPVALELDRRTRRFRIEPVATLVDERLTTRTRIRVEHGPHGGEPFQVEGDDYTAAGTRGEASLWLDGIVLEAATLSRAVDTLDALAAGVPSAPYR